jgi:hypothetical protein
MEGAGAAGAARKASGGEGTGGTGVRNPRWLDLETYDPT